MSSHAAHKLSALFVEKTNKAGKYSDGLGLYLIVEPTGSKRWEQRLTIKGKRCDLCLGSTKLATLEETRLTAQSNKKTAKGDGDPRQVKKLQEGERLSFYDVTLSAHQVLAPAFKREILRNSFSYCCNDRDDYKRNKECPKHGKSDRGGFYSIFASKGHWH